jgi:lipopolysaccharide export system protein LptA
MRPPALALLACALACTAAHAERADREKKIVVLADHLSAEDTNRTSLFEGDVVVTQGTMRMTASKVTVKEDAQRHKYYVAYGAPVTFRQKRDKVDEWVEGFADRAEFDDLNDILKLYNRAKVKSNQNEITGDFISYDMNKELAEVSGAPPGTAPPPNSGRVKMVILPPKKAPEGAAAGAEKAAAGVALKPDAGTQ